VGGQGADTSGVPAARVIKPAGWGSRHPLDGLEGAARTRSRSAFPPTEIFGVGRIIDRWAVRWLEARRGESWHQNPASTRILQNTTARAGRHHGTIRRVDVQAAGRTRQTV